MLDKGIQQCYDHFLTGLLEYNCPASARADQLSRAVFPPTPTLRYLGPIVDLNANHVAAGLPKLLSSPSLEPSLNSLIAHLREVGDQGAVRRAAASHMPAVTTSSATGSRVLQKPMSADAARSSQDRSVEDPAADGISTKSVKEQQESPGKRSSSSSNNMSSKIKRFPTLLSRKESRSKAETTANGNGNPRSASNGDGRRKSTSGTSPGSGTTKPSTPSHGRSISLAAATPSSLPRPVANAGLPASATSPNLSEQASGNTSQQPLSPTSIAGSPRRVPPPGQESGIPRLVTSARSASGTPVPGRTESNASAQDDPAKPTALRESSAEERVGPLASGSIAGALGSADNHNPADVASKGSPTIPGAGSQLYVVNGSASPDPAASDVSR